MEVKGRKQERRDLEPGGRGREMGRTPMWIEPDQRSVFQDLLLPNTSPVSIARTDFCQYLLLL